MRQLFNGDCSSCQLHRPRCATVYVRVPNRAKQFEREPIVLCDVCRKSEQWIGRFRADARHR